MNANKWNMGYVRLRQKVVKAIRVEDRKAEGVSLENNEMNGATADKMPAKTLERSR